MKNFAEASKLFLLSPERVLVTVLAWTNLTEEASLKSSPAP